MTEEDVVDIIKSRLTISLDSITEFGPVECIKVSLEFDGEVISDCICTLPEPNA